MCVYMYIYMCVCVYVYIYIYIYNAVPKYGMIFIVWLVQFLKKKKTNKKHNKFKFSWLPLLFKHFFLKLKFSQLWVSKKRNNKESYDLLNAESKPKFLHLPYTTQRKIFDRKRPFYGKGQWKSEQKMKSIFNCSCYSD